MPIFKGFKREGAEVTGFSTAWRKSSYADQERDISTLVDSNHALKIAQAELKAAVDPGNMRASEALAEVDSHSEWTDEVLRGMIETKSFNYQHGPEGATTNAVTFFRCRRVG